MDVPSDSSNLKPSSTDSTNKDTSLLIAQQDNNFPNTHPIKHITEEMKLTTVHSQSVMSLILLKDNRIASGSIDGSISICSINIIEHKWTRNIHKANAHNNWVCTLCELTDTTLVSGGADCQAKIWKILPNELQHIKTISTFTNIINSIISLTKGRFASCSDDKTIQIWEDTTYQHIITFNSDIDYYKSLVQLNGKDTLVACGYTSYLSFWNIDTYVNVHNMKGYNVSRPSYMIALPNGNVALCSKVDQETIIIINTSSYKEIKRIKVENYITKPTTLCVVNEDSFMYVRDGNVVQVSNVDYSVISKVKGNRFDAWFGGVVLIEDGKYFVTTSRFDLTVMKIEYE